MVRYYLDNCFSTQNAQKFVDLYSTSYYLGQPKIVKNARQSSKYVEDKMDELLTRIYQHGKITAEDVIHIMAWKMGRIKHAESKNSFVYYKGWNENINTASINSLSDEDLRSLTVKLPSRKKGEKTFEFRIGELSWYITNHYDELRDEAENNPQAFLNRNDIRSIKGIGPIYHITLLYFLSGGKYQIYDKFAMMALHAIKKHIKPGCDVEYKELCSTDDVMNNEDTNPYGYSEYRTGLEEVFGEGYQYKNNRPDRSVDRALWVYGHYFKAVTPRKLK